MFRPTYPTIDEADYDMEVQRKADRLRKEVAEETGLIAGRDEDAEEVMDEAVAQVGEAIADHEWFRSGTGGLNGADYGSIISDFCHYNGDIHQFRDITTLTGSDDSAKIVRNLAFAQFEADVLTAFRYEDWYVPEVEM